jgi:hypothetical protein
VSNAEQYHSVADQANRHLRPTKPEDGQQRSSQKEKGAAGAVEDPDHETPGEPLFPPVWEDVGILDAPVSGRMTLKPR